MLKESADYLLQPGIVPVIFVELNERRKLKAWKDLDIFGKRVE